MQYDLGSYDELANNLYQKSSPESQARLAHLLEPSDPKVLTEAQMLLNQTSNPFTQILALATFNRVLSRFWTNFEGSTRINIKNYLLQFMGNNCSNIRDFVMKELLKLVSVIVKRGWFDGDGMQKTPAQIHEFLSAGSEMHSLMGLMLLNTLVHGINERPFVPQMTRISHRKVAISFRDNYLLDIFRLALQSCKELMALPRVEKLKMKELAIQLTFNCLNFDFIGTLLNETTGDQGTVQLPGSWKGVIEDPDTMQLFFSFYTSTEPPLSDVAMQCLVQMSCVRRSLFSEEMAKEYVSRLLRGMQDIFTTRAGLSHLDNHHQLCRLLARLKSNFQLAQIASVPEYPNWIRLLAQFTIDTFKSWKWAPNSIYYLLSMWAQFVASIVYVRDVKSFLDRYVPEVTEAYILSRLESVPAAARGEVEDPLLDHEAIHDELDTLPHLGRCVYSHTSRVVTSLFDRVAQHYRALLEQGVGGESSELRVAEGQLAWAVNIMAAVVGGRLGVSHMEDQDALDGEMACRLFSLLEWHGGVLEKRGGQPCFERLEVALLYFFGQFRRSYVGETVTVDPMVYRMLGERVGIPHQTAALSVILQKIVTNFKVWGGSVVVVQKTLQLFFDLTIGFTSGKLLLTLDIVPQLLACHTPQFFPFLARPELSRSRTVFYDTLGRLLVKEKFVSQYADFMQPFAQQFAFLASIPTLEQLRAPPVRAALIGLLRDLRGVLSATLTKGPLKLFFEWIYPQYLPLLPRLAGAFADDPEVMAPLLKFVGDLAHNRSKRIAFPTSSPNGILLFREVAAILVEFGRKLAAQPAPEAKSYYARRVKGVWMAMMVLTRALSGGYCNFGVFALYNDPALANAIEVVLQLALSLPQEDIMTFPKVSVHYFAFVEVLCRDHAPVVFSSDSKVFLSIMQSVKMGIVAPQENISSSCCVALNKITSTYFKAKKKGHAPHLVAAFERHVAQQPTLFPEFLEILFNMIVFSECSNQWPVSRPLLTLILICPDAFDVIQKQLVASQGSPEAQKRMVDAFEMLMKDIADNLLTHNRDRFTEHLNQFKASLVSVGNETVR